MHEFPSIQEIDLTDPRLFYKLNDYRADLDFKVHPPPVHGALARESGKATSRHFAIGKLSTAVDFFPDCDIKQAWLCTIHYFGGVGVYFDTCYKHRKWCMLHGDLRQNQTLWYRENGIYHTLHTEADYKFLMEKLSNGNNNI